MGKVIGGGLPAAALGGRARADGADRAGRRRLPGGQLSGNPLAVAAGLRRWSCSTKPRTRAWRRRPSCSPTGLRDAAGERPVQVVVARRAC